MDRLRCKDQHKSSLLSVNQADLGCVYYRTEREREREGEI